MNLSGLEALPAGDFLRTLAERDIRLGLQEGRLRINAPAGAITDDLKSEMVRRKDLLIRACRSACTIHGELVLRDPDAEHSEAPLTHAQERLWLLDQFDPGNPVYNIPEVFEITTPLNPVLLQQALNTITKRHEVLRTYIVQTSDKVIQRVSQDATITIVIEDLSSHPVDDREAHLKTLLRDESRRPFELTLAPLARIRLYKFGDNQHFLFVNLHHIIADRWSTSILYRELLRAYIAHEQNRIPDLPKLPIQYSDYAVWERSGSAAHSNEQMLYWQQQLSDLPQPLTLPFAGIDHSTSASEGAVFALELSVEDTARLRSFAKKQRASLYMVLLTAYCVLLHRYTGVSDLCVGSPVSERSFPEAEPLIGLFVNTLVLRCKIADHASFIEVLKSVRETVLDAHAHRGVPFQKILDCATSSQPGLLSAGQVFQTMFAFDPLTSAPSSTGGASVALDPGVAKFNLTLQMREESDRISGWFEYKTEIASHDSIGRFSAVFLRLLGEMLTAPSRHILEFEILSPEEKKLLLHTWNDTAMPLPVGYTIHQMFEEQAARTPHQIALIDGEHRFTYGQLENASNRVARLLLDAGAGNESIVGVLLPRTAEMIAALLGILKAGAAYLPIDERHPQSRVQTILEDSGCSLVLSNVGQADWPSHPARLLHLPAVFHGSLQSRIQTDVASTSLAYVIYTSGSTGVPKGVAIEHHSVVSLLTWGRSKFSDEQLQGTLASTAISFDLSVFEIFLPLTTGGTVILANDILGLPDLPSLSEVTLATTVPSVAAAMLDAGSIPASLKNLHLAGEPLSENLVNRLYSETQLESIYDLYGPTETTTYSTCTLRHRGQPANIGRPIGNTRAYLLDQSLHLVPIGLVGELFIAGEGVARGYLNRAELTRDAFVSLEHLGELGRAYRTGDLCSYNRDGTLVYHGRRDQQVKINGFRVELGEIEAVLQSHPSVKEAVVVQASAGASALAAAVRSNEGIDEPELVRYQSSLLPSHMVVRRLIKFDVLPQLSNGKVDRKKIALQIASAHANKNRKEFVSSDKLDRQVLSIWRDAFRDEIIGMDDDFFEIGGHSLLALRIFSEIEARLGQRVMLSVMFHAPTVRLLAHQLRTRQVNRRLA